MYFAVEGLGGSGKSTAIPFIANLLGDLTGKEVFLTREPGGPPQAEAIRERIFHCKRQGISSISLVELFYDARVISIAEHIVPNLRQGKLVLGDRYAASTMAYEGGGEGMSHYIVQTHKDRVGLFGPDATLYFRISDPEAGLKRRSYHNGDSFDRESPDYFRRVLETYDTLYQENCNPEFVNPIWGYWLLINADVSVSQVQKQIRESLVYFLEWQLFRHALGLVPDAEERLSVLKLLHDAPENG